MQFRQDMREKIGSERLNNAETYGAAEQVLPVPGEFDDVLNVAKDRSGARGDRVAGGCQDNAGPAALHQLNAELRFKIPKLPAQGRLGDIGQFGRLAKMQGFGERNQIAKLLKGGNRVAPGAYIRKFLSKP